MGGGHHEPFKVPDYKIYSNYKAFPELVEHENKLARMGLKDPWIRNYVWIYDQRNLHGFKLAQKSILSGFGVGLVYAAVAIVVTEAYTRFNKKPHGHHGEHGKEHHGH